MHKRCLRSSAAAVRPTRLGGGAVAHEFNCPICKGLANTLLMRAVPSGPHVHREWARLSQIGAAAGLTAAKSARGLGSPLQRSSR